jgi:hypothetical protein
MKKKWYLIIGITIIILISSIYLLFFTCFNCWGGIVTQYETAKSQACGVLMREGNCSSDIKSTISITIKGFDANKDGNIDNKDTLFELCKNYYGVKNDCECKYICGCVIKCD